QLEQPLAECGREADGLRLAAGRRHRAQVVALERDPQRREHHLRGLAVDDAEDGPEDLVSVDDCGERVLERLRVDGLPEADREPEVVERAAGASWSISQSRVWAN